MSKRIFQHPEEPADGTKYWRSTGQLVGSEESKKWVEREFQPGASELNPEVGRRGFMDHGERGVHLRREDPQVLVDLFLPFFADLPARSDAALLSSRKRRRRLG